MPNNDAAPPDDDITKTVLWNRIQTLHDTVELINSQLQNRIQTFLDSAKNMTQGQLDDNRQFIQAYNSELDSKINIFTKIVQKTVYDAVDALKKENMKNISVLEEKIRVMQASIPHIVTAQTKSYLDPTNEKVAALSKDMDVYKKALLNVVGKFNTEAIAKISSLNAKLDEVLKKFRSLSSAI